MTGFPPLGLKFLAQFLKQFTIVHDSDHESSEVKHRGSITKISVLVITNGIFVVSTEINELFQ